MVNIELSPALAWGEDKEIKILLSDDNLSSTDNPTITVLEEGSAPSNSVVVTLAYKASSRKFEGVVYLTNKSSSNKSPKLVLTKDCTVQFSYANGDEEGVTSLTYYMEQPVENGKYVEVRSSVRNLHWDLVTILCKGGWKFVETLPPKVNADGYVTEFTHILKTVTTPKEDENGEAVFTEMFLVISHENYPGNNSGNFKRITFKVTPNYYYYDRSVEGSAPDSRSNDVLYNLENIYKCAEYPTYPVNIDFISDSVSNSLPNVLDIPVNIFGYVSQDFFTFVFQGEPSLTTDGFGMVGHVYCGMIESFKEGKLDVGGNFALTGSSSNAQGGTRYGEQTSDGVSTVSMYRTYGGLLWQRHYASIIHDDPKGETRKSELYQPSSYTGKFHLSPVYIYHSTDGKRGTLHNVLAVNKQGILHLDELEIIKPISECDPCPVDSQGLPIDPNDTEHAEYEKAWKREKYKYYRLTGSSHFLSSFEIRDQYDGIGIAVKMETDEDKCIKFNTAYDIVTGHGVSSWTGIGAVPEGAEIAGARTESISAGLVTLSTGGNASTEPTLTGSITKMQKVSESGTVTSVIVEAMVNEDPIATSALKCTVVSKDRDDDTIGAISCFVHRAGELDTTGSSPQYGFRGTFFVTDTGNTDDGADLIKYASGGTLTATIQSMTKSLNM